MEVTMQTAVEAEKTKHYMDLAKDAGIELHSVSAANDVVLLRWWMALHNLNEINDLISPDAQAIDDFVHLFRPPTYLLRIVDDQSNLLQAHWFKPVSSRKDETDVFNGIWTHPELRGKKQQLRFTYLTYRIAFCFCTAIIGTTWQTKLLVEHMKMGYDIVGKIPNFSGHSEFYFVRLTEEKFIASRAGLAGERLIQRS
jgi:hypothetical protein